jgi:hypothetical protein
MVNKGGTEARWAERRDEVLSRARGSFIPGLQRRARVESIHISSVEVVLVPRSCASDGSRRCDCVSVANPHFHPHLPYPLVSGGLLQASDVSTTRQAKSLWRSGVIVFWLLLSPCVSEGLLGAKTAFSGLSRRRSRVRVSSTPPFSSGGRLPPSRPPQPSPPEPPHSAGVNPAPLLSPPPPTQPHLRPPWPSLNTRDEVASCGPSALGLARPFTTRPSTHRCDASRRRPPCASHPTTRAPESRPPSKPLVSIS